jgi:hypothetical protein
MKQFILFISMVLFACRLMAQDPAYPASPPTSQNIIKAEYFIDVDPGFGNGVNIPFTTGIDINNLSVSVNTTGLSNGVHLLWIRTRNNEGNWSVTIVRDFIVDFDAPYLTIPPAPQNIVRAEYFIDTDPGIGNGVSISFGAAVNITNLVAGINTTGIGNGIHRLYIRTRNNEGAWAITNNKDFLVDSDPAYPSAPAAPQNITQAEYFINTDPGIGNGTGISITPAVDISNLVVGINTSALTPATTNRLYLRTRNNEGSWSITNIGTFVVDIVSDPVYPSPPPAPQNIVQAEYFLNTDPGIGNGTAITITPALDINNLVTSINTSALTPSTTNRLYLRTKNNEGKWSITNIATFVVDIVRILHRPNILLIQTPA